MSDTTEVYMPGTSSNTATKQEAVPVQEPVKPLPNLDSTTTLSLSDLTSRYTPRQIILGLGNIMYASAQQELEQAGDDSSKQQTAYLKLAQAERMRNLSIQF